MTRGRSFTSARLTHNRLLGEASPRICAGFRAEVAPGDPLARLLGGTRAALLRLALREQATTELARELGVSAATVSSHTKTLRAAGLIVTVRSGKAVLHSVTPLGDQLLEVRDRGSAVAVIDGKPQVEASSHPENRGDTGQIGLPVVQHAHDLGVNVLCAHKGLPLLNFESTWNQPRDMVAVSRQFPGMQFVVYHAGWTPQHVEGPYNPADPVGVDSLLWALDRYQVPPNSNVWADLATVWRNLLADPVQAAHVLGKLLSRLGEDRVLWGTDSVWYGPPQTQIMAFRAFEISEEFQRRYAYPALTDTVKAKVLGLNAARLWSLDPHATRCALATDSLDRNRPASRALADAGELPPPWTPRGPVTRGQILHWLADEPGPWIPT